MIGSCRYLPARLLTVARCRLVYPAQVCGEQGHQRIDPRTRIVLHLSEPSAPREVDQLGLACWGGVVDVELAIWGCCVDVTPGCRFAAQDQARSPVRE